MAVHIVSGASRGVGEAIAAQLLDRGDQVAGIARHRSSRLGQAAAEAAGRLRWYERDLSDPATIDTTVAEILRDTDAARAELVTFFAAAARLEPIATAGGSKSSLTEDIDTALRLNLVAPAAMTHRLLAELGTAGPRIRIVLLSSGASQRPMPGLGIYGASKAGLNSFVASVQAEVDLRASVGRVAIWAVSPGIVDTSMQTTMRAQDPAALPERDTYRSWHAEGQLASPDAAAGKIISVIERDDLPPGSYIHARDL